eukprot:3269368-Pyramimonas_sp.AAC.1
MRVAFPLGASANPGAVGPTPICGSKSSRRNHGALVYDVVSDVVVKIGLVARSPRLGRCCVAWRLAQRSDEESNTGRGLA